MIGGITATLSGVWSALEKENWWRSDTGITFIISTVLICIGSFKIWQDAPAIKILQGEVRISQGEVARLEDRLAQIQEDYFRTFEIQLEALYNELGFSDAERISLYIHKDEHFTMIARYSINPTFYDRGRVNYPDNKGCIGEAWVRGRAFENSAPDPLRNETQYVEHMRNRWKMSETTIRSLTMRSRNLAAYAIENFQSPNKRVAVVVFESLERNRTTEYRLRRVVEGNYFRQIGQLLVAMRSLEPLPRQAREEGY